ncbi:MAG: NAD(P)-dependent oxidoreductase [Lentisphaerae bacterium]|nr:NAD(P)-dependent oxidoreductase [Lentisphaerota bacterium]
MHVVITGAAGVVGHGVREALAAHHTLTLLDRRPHASLPTSLVDLSDRESALAAIPKADVLIHLGAIPVEVSGAEIVRHNILATVNVYDAACACGIPRVVFASTMQVYGALIGNAAAWPLDPERHAAPDSHYACSKRHGELLGTLYAQRHGLAVISLRLGWYVRKTDNHWPAVAPPYVLGVADAARLFVRCVEAPHTGAVIVNGVSRGGEHVFSLEAGRRALGFEPQDSAEEAMRQHRMRIERELAPA